MLDLQGKDFKNKYSNTRNVKIVGSKLHKEIPLYLKSADVLGIPNTAKENISRLYTSPMKLFEYMASGTPIVASDLPSLREVLNGSNSVLFESDSMGSLKNSLIRLINDELLQNNISKQAIADVYQYSWDNRSKKILNFIFR